jgi:hypothetical protein
MIKPGSAAVGDELAWRISEENRDEDLIPKWQSPIGCGDAAIPFRFVFLYIAAAGPGALSLDGLLRKPN